eukprot:TRINITY_DN54803_c0_g1_i1.p1 TRINITY_DN54803_c0_g1~~TRINITY_DN54803_c0_g1_i1.p1  ORF type:complete len:290 (-),score=32.64 TRINITY_DN54803_c0_g1_i1:294-1079(-)
MADYLVNFAMLHTEPDKLREYLFIGAVGAAHNVEGLQKLGITHVLNTADDVEDAHPETFECLRLMIKDGGEDATIVENFDIATDFVRLAIRSGGKVLIHCLFGMNRSATIAMAILMNLEAWQLSQTYDHIVKQRPKVKLKQGNKEKLALWELRTRHVSTMLGWLPEEARVAEVERQLQAPATAPVSRAATQSKETAGFISSRLVRGGVRLLRSAGGFCLCKIGWKQVRGTKRSLLDADAGDFCVHGNCGTHEPHSKRQRVN